MLVKCMSDLHWHASGNDHKYVDHGESVCILAGDIAEGLRGVNWALYTIPKHIKVLYVPGNHEYYGNEYFALNERFREHNSKNTHVTVLLNDTIEIGGIVFAGTTLWSDFNVYKTQEAAKVHWRNGLNDHTWIKYGDNRIEADDFIFLYDESLAFLSKVDADVLISHYGYKDSESTRWKYHPLTPGFISDIPESIHSKFKYHFHGHTHTTFDYVKDYGTRVICNPKGYFMENTFFNEELVIDIRR